MCCTPLTENTGRKKIAKKSPSGDHRTTLSNIMAHFGPLTAEINSEVWGTPADFNGFLVLASLLQRCRSLQANQTLHDVCPSSGLVHYMYIFGGSCPVMEFCQVQNSLYV